MTSGLEKACEMEFNETRLGGNSWFLIYLPWQGTYEIGPDGVVELP
jgi:hypothetical protein